MSTGEPDATEIGHVRFGGGSSEKGQVNWHLVGGLPYGQSGSAGGRTEKDPRTADTSPYGLPSRPVPRRTRLQAAPPTAFPPVTVESSD
jgi:hypothetical protein